jgi:diaminopimelate epimerase
VTFHFYKYQATGNDFVLIDNRSAGYSFSKDEIEKICHRRFGVGADGLMLIEKHPVMDFNLIYYNSDGSQSLCGNGSRAAVTFASHLGIINGNTEFNAFDGAHSAEILPAGKVRLKMKDVSKTESKGDAIFMNTGSPHHIQFLKNVEHHAVFEEGKKIRYSQEYAPAGTNVNFVELLPDNTIYVRTYERGVENETLSCGTGVVASALAASTKGYQSPVKVKALGGDLSVDFKSSQSGTFTDIFLTGPAKLVFEGDLEL